MSNVIVDVKDIVKNIGKNIDFMQPVYEAIVNSLEANARNIEVEFFRDIQLSIDGECPKLGSFTISDNGEGFIFENRESFKKLWTTHKMTMGCKGSGRFTWLNVYNKIEIISKIPTTQEFVKIPFSINFGAEDIKVMNLKEKIDEPQTIIKFSDLTLNIYNNVSDRRKRIDKREDADLDKIYNKIYNYLLVKLFLLNKKGITFNITIKLDNKTRIIDNASIPRIEVRNFSIVPSLVNTNAIDFELYYLFLQDGKKSKKINLCANERVVEVVDDNELGFSASLPNNDSFTMMLCSNYFDINVSDDRMSLSGLKGLKNESYTNPVLLSTIILRTKEEINKIIEEKYPQLNQINNEIKTRAINNAPHLSKYINQNKALLISESSLIKDAKKSFNEDKERVHSKFTKILRKADIDLETFSESIDNISQIALFELGEYIHYRKAIISALDKSLLDEEKKEEYIHNIFMPMGEIARNNKDYLLNNLWLLDDKFMTYSFAASDVTINKIINEIEEKDKEKFATTKKPDLTIFYNKNLDRDLVVVEFKGVNASLGEKEKSISEIVRNSLIIQKNIQNVKTTWSYIITEIDDEFEISLTASEFKPLFSNSNDSKIYYRYYPTINTHVYAVDVKAIVEDASARNSTFLNILKNSK